MTSRSCPALLISAPASGQGKTTVTAALARMHARAGRKVRVFKCGPDFLDPMILARASGQPVYQLDLWIQGEAECRRLLWEAAQEADLILVEGVMGLFDGSPSSADLSEKFKLPVLAVINASAMAATFAAIAFGLANFRPGLRLTGVFANRIGSERHAHILRESLAAAGGPLWFGALPKALEISLPSRHLGLVQAEELTDLDLRLDAAAQAIAQNLAAEATTNPNKPDSCLQNTDNNAAQISHLPPLPPIAEFQCSAAPVIRKLLSGLRIGIARDAAFSFIYQANLDLLTDLGAELVFFSPLRDAGLPPVDSLYLPGGYPELHLEALHSNTAMLRDLRSHQAAQKPILAEGGGLLYLLESLRDLNGRELPLAGLLPGRAIMQKNLAGLGSQEVTLPEGTLRGHIFHHARLESDLPPLTRGAYPVQSGKHKSTQNGKKDSMPCAQNKPGGAVYRLARLTASSIHLYFPSNPEAVANLFKI
ncbi:MAG: cobyrinate a,c-diamide synthase [Deltaproteobacteria bacterium]|jgi:cobyrinic acid a,c-diamide synthase|nr:cobyrinate a,c-diamide synthase [Deltaproteobacteria bacterium]